jgi:hypothetical protein
MLKLLRRLLFIPAPVICEGEAVDIANAKARELGWLTEMKAKPLERLREWIVILRPNACGSPHIAIDNQTGEVTRVSIPLR